MNIETSDGIMIFDCDKIPTNDDMNDIISSVTSDEYEFIELCNETTKWDEMNVYDFYRKCEKWVEERK